ncbi:MAG: MBL fold metallo-hydrolase [Chloroflexota bacterium]
MIKPVLSNDAFLNDVYTHRSQADTLNIWWLGQSGYLVQYNSEHLLLDPYLSDSLTKKYANTPKPHVRMTEIVIAPERLDFIDVATSSHNHTDHLDGETIIPLMQVNAEMTMIVPEANRDFAANRFQMEPARLTGVTLDTPITVGSFTFRSVPAAHEEIEQDENGHHKFIGLMVEVGPYTIYHSGDTMLYDGMTETLLAAANGRTVDVALLPINGRDPKRGVAGNLSGLEAVQVGRDINAQLVIPCHYEMFEFNTVSPEAFVEGAEDSGQSYHVLKCGERLTFD